MQKLEESFFNSLPPMALAFAGGGSRNWRERSNIVNFVERIVSRIHEYGVLLNNSNTTEETRQKEKERLKKLFREKINAA
jgi:hypothetical protein